MLKNIPYKAFLFDLNGTMVDDMQYHAVAWHNIFKDLGADLTFEQVKHEMYGKNNEVLHRVFGESRFTLEEMDKLSINKEKAYQAEFRPHLQLISGLASILKDAHEYGIKQAICSAAIPFNIDFVLDGLNIRKYFNTIVSADDVAKSKPDPETFSKAAERFGLKPNECLVFEDVPKGVEAARNAGMKCVVITTMHHPDEFSHLDNIIGFIKDYNDTNLEQFLQYAEV